MVATLKDMLTNGIKSQNPEREILDYCNKAYNISRNGRFPFERAWYMHLAFYFGKHYAQWVTTALDNSALQSEVSFSKLYEPPVPNWRVRLICNRIRTVIRGEMAKITKEKPRGFVIPSTTDEADLAGARAGEAIHEFLWREIHMNRVMRRAVFWELVCGTSFVKDWYDKDKPINGVKGAICAEPVTPFHLLVPDLQQEEMDAQPYVIHEMAKDPSWIARHYKDKDGRPIEVQADSTSVGGGILEQRFLAALGISGSEVKNYVSIREGWFQPSGKFKDGFFAAWTKDRVLHHQEGWPYDHKEYPYTKLDHIPTGRFYAESSIADLIPLQKEYNRTRSQIIEAKNRMSKPQLLAIRGSIDPNRITSEPGLVIFYKPGFAAPTPLQLQNLPNYVLEEVERIKSDMDDVSSQHDISRGSTPPGVSAATAISFLQEQDDSKLLLTVASLEEGVERLGKHFLSHVAQFWKVERMVQVTGVNGQWEAYKFKSESLHGNTNFKIEAGSATPVSRAAKQAFILELMKNGYVPPEQGLKYLDMSETGRMYEELQRDARQAQRENMRMLDGQKVNINTFDIDLIHVQEHEGVCKTEEYETAKDEVKANMQEHLTWHRQKMAMMQGIQLPPDDPQLIAIGRGQPPIMPQQPGGMNGGQPQLNGAAPQGGENAVPVGSPA
jgi:hypothetical protein